MDSSVKSRPSYYELLWLTPNASAEEIGRAFAREVGLFRPRQFGGLAEVGLAYETLRDPARRADYDASIGIRREKAPAPRPYITNAVYLSATPRYAGLTPRAPEVVAPPDPRPEVQPQPEPVPAPPSYLVSPLPKPDQPAVESGTTEVRRRAIIAIDAEDGPIEFNRTIGIGAAMILAVAVTAAWAGSQAGRAAQGALPKGVVTAALPKARAARPVAEPATAIPEVPVPQARSVAVRPQPRMVRAIASRPQVAEAPARSITEQNRFARESIAQALAEPPAVTETPAPAVAASMPLPAGTVARTIDRIGYSCGKVSSTVAGETAGVFTVTCTSGQSFQAKPVRGRYHFRRMGG